MGYQFRSTVLNACDYGDPQNRHRLIMFASRKTVMLPQMPKPTRGKAPGLLPLVEVRHVLDGQVFDERDPYDGLRKTKLLRGAKNLIHLRADSVSPAMRAGGPCVFHYEFDRCLTVKEFQLLQSFPVEYKITGTCRQKYRQIGNAVPVKTAKAIARAVEESLCFRYAEEGDETQPQKSDVAV